MPGRSLQHNFTTLQLYAAKARPFQVARPFIRCCVPVESSCVPLTSFRRFYSVTPNMASMATVAASLMKSFKSRLIQLSKSFDIGICCSKCAVEAPEGPKGEYYLLGNLPSIEEGICFTGHTTCSRDWILCKERTMVTWSRVRPMYKNAESPSNISICEYTVGKKCPNGEMCVKAHSDVEYGVWTMMIELKLDFGQMHGVLLEEIGKYTAKTMKKGDEAEKPDDIDINGNSDDAKPMAIPEDAVRPGCRYEEQGFFVNVTKKTYLTIRTTHVCGPDRFYFQLCENIERMEECWKDMNNFYQNDPMGDKYKMVEDDLLRKLPVAAKIWSKDGVPSWRRAEIIDFTLGNDCLVEVMDVDFGAMANVPLSDVRLLRAEYFIYQKQGIEGAVAYVRPVKGDHWSDEAVEVVRSFFEKWPLVAEVVGTKGDCLAMMVCDTTDPKVDVYVADLLSKSGYGVAFNDVKPLVFSGKEALTKNMSESKQVTIDYGGD